MAINKNLDKFINTQIVFISFESVKEIKVFADKYHFLDKKNVLFLSDYNSNFSEIFDAHHIPYTLIYNKHQKLVKNYKGEVKIEAILKHLVVK